VHAKLAAAGAEFAVVTEPAANEKVARNTLNVFLAPPGTAGASALPNRRAAKPAATAAVSSDTDDNEDHGEVEDWDDDEERELEEGEEEVRV